MKLHKRAFRLTLIIMGITAALCLLILGTAYICTIWKWTAIPFTFLYIGISNYFLLAYTEKDYKD